MPILLVPLLEWAVNKVWFYNIGYLTWGSISSKYLIKVYNCLEASPINCTCNFVMRLNMQAGADACFVEAPRNDDELKKIGLKTNGYRVCNMLEGGVTPLHTPEELKAMGFHLIVHPLTSLYASARAILDVLKTLKEKGTTRDHLDKMATFEEFNQLVELESWFELEARFSNSRNIARAKSWWHKGI